MKAWECGDNVPMLRVQMLECGIVSEDVHSLTLRKNDADRAILENQPRFAFQKNRHLLIDQQYFLASGAKGFGGFNEEIEQGWMSHQAIHFIHRNHTRLLVYEAIAANCGQDLCV